MMSPGIMQALARERENEIARRAARRETLRAPNGPGVARVRTRLTDASGNGWRERRPVSQATDPTAL
jgi:hypothetical protein